MRKVIKQLGSAFSNKSIGSFLLAEENVILDSIGLVLMDLQVRRVNSVETTGSIRGGHYCVAYRKNPIGRGF